ncbi:TonB-dependent receptor [Gilvimarinus sp. F26214L]|uniref:TonB-dependent receptor n=1 Tax=Gilvimarinus sp. DZF01 TaxID=3461371 RepID=UPI0040460DD3
MTLFAPLSPGAHAAEEHAGRHPDTDDRNDELIEEVVVTGQALALRTEMEPETERLLNVAGAGIDPLAAALSLPGVTFTSDHSSEPAVRGSAPDDNGYYVDFIPARYVFHMFGNSILSHELIHSFDLYPAAFGSQFSDATGAVIDVQLRDPRNQAFSTTLDASFLSAGLLLESGITDNQAFYASYRRSLFDQFVKDPESIDENSGVTIQQLPVAEDYQFKYRWDLNPLNRLTVLAAGASDEVAATLRPHSDMARRDPAFAGPAAVTTGFDSHGLAWDRLSESGKHGLNLTITRTSDYDNAHYGTAQFLNIDTDRQMLRGQWDANLSEAHHLTVGGWLEETEYQLGLNAKLPPCSSFDPACPTIDAPLVRLDDHFEMNSQVGYLEDFWSISPNFSLRAGLHYMQDDYLNGQALDPRLRLQWQATEQWRLHAAYGHYAQLPEPGEFAPALGNPQLGYIESAHSVLGVERRFGEGWSWRVEAYHKSLNNLPLSLSADRDPDFQNRYSNDVSGETYGLELLLKKDLTEKLYGWLAVSLSRSERRNERSGEVWKSDYDKPAIVNWVMNYQASERWLLGMKWSYRSGQLYTPVVDTRPNANNPAVSESIYGPLNSERLPAYHRLDLRAEYSRPTGYGMWSMFVDLLNAYNQENLQAISSTPDRISGDMHTTRSEGLGVFPSIGFKVQF